MPVRCDAAIFALTDYLDGLLALERCRQIEEHRARCGICQGVYLSLRRTIQLVGAAHAFALPPGATRRMVASVLAHLAAAEPEPSGRRVPPRRRIAPDV
ncbi:MAG TPA: hypothetical protein VJS92_01080 [Candidatus Polarisedimenticolaceae bacterium]|nr:hypothetical protein [Candidatus Polarisedimenticolaceae bacterium]